MTRQSKARILTGVLIAALCGLVAARQSGWSPSALTVSDLINAAPQARQDPTPQDAIYAMLDAAREGRVPAYLGYYTGPMETSLKQSIAEQGQAAFGKYLRETNEPIKGVAITEPQALTDREVKVRVEYVYQDRNEAQYFYLEKHETGWKIARLDQAERVKTLVPYGTPVQ